MHAHAQNASENPADRNRNEPSRIRVSAIGGDISCTLVHESTAHNLVALQHTIHQIAEWSPIILPTRKRVLIDEQDVVLEAGIQMGLEPQMYDDGVVMAIDMGVDTVQTLEYLAQETRKCLGEGNTCIVILR